MSQKVLITALAATLIMGGCKKKDKPVETDSAPVSTETSTSNSAPSATPEATPESTVETTAPATIDYVARGNEPFWSISISGDQATYKTPEMPDGVTMTVSKTMVAGAPQFRGTMDGQEFMLALTSVECEDDMSGDKFPMTATLLMSTGTYGGCGGQG